MLMENAKGLADLITPRVAPAVPPTIATIVSSLIRSLAAAGNCSSLVARIAFATKIGEFGSTGKEFMSPILIVRGVEAEAEALMMLLDLL